MSSGLDLGKQIGPLPLGAWFAVVAGGLGIAAYSRNSAVDTTTPEIVDDTGTTPGVGTGAVGGWDGAWTQTQPGNVYQEPQITDNEAWGKAAINWLIAQGYNPAWSYAAITKALAGGRGDSKLSVREYSLWNAALRHMGAPPYPVDIPPPSNVPTPKPTPKPKKHTFVDRNPRNGRCDICNKSRYDFSVHYASANIAHPTPGSFRYATVAPKPLPGSTLSSLAQIYYKDRTKWHKIYEANQYGKRRADGTPGLIRDAHNLRPGWRLIVPR